MSTVPLDYKARAEHWEREALAVRAGANRLREKRQELSTTADSANWVEETILAEEARVDGFMQTARRERLEWVAQTLTEAAEVLKRPYLGEDGGSLTAADTMQMQAAAARLLEVRDWLRTHA